MLPTRPAEKLTTLPEDGFAAATAWRRLNVPDEPGSPGVLTVNVRACELPGYKMPAAATSAVSAIGHPDVTARAGGNASSIAAARRRERSCKIDGDTGSTNGCCSRYYSGSGSRYLNTRFAVAKRQQISSLEVAATRPRWRRRAIYRAQLRHRTGCGRRYRQQRRRFFYNGPKRAITTQARSPKQCAI